MSDSRKPWPWPGTMGPCPVMLFRLGLVHQVLARSRHGKSIAAAALAVAATAHVDLRGVLWRVSERSLRRWVARYEELGEEGLRPTPREKATGPVGLRGELVEFLIAEKRADAQASIPELLRRARVEGVLGPTERVWRSTVNRTLTRMGIVLARRRRSADRDSRSFEYPHRLDMVMCDGKHFRAGASRAKRVALNFVDDATRKYLLAVVGPSESTRLFLRGLHGLLSRYGRPSALYLDKGPGFTSLDTREVLRRLDDLPLIIGETAYPQGHGKVERFHQTLGEDVLRSLPGDPEVDPGYDALELRLEHYRTRIYNARAHEGLGKESPAARFARDDKPLDLRDPAWLEERFGAFEVRRVSAHHLVKLGGEEYEVPRGLAGSWVTLERRVLEDDRLLLRHEGRLIELHRVDKVANARSRRGGRREAEGPTDLPRPRTAAGRSFSRDFASVLDDDGGFRDPQECSAGAPPDDDDTGETGEEA